MSSLDASFAELREHLRQSPALHPARSDPFFYFVHAPEEALTVKQKAPLWRAVLAQDGWEVAVVSFADLLWEVVDQSGRWEEWLELEPESDLRELNETMRAVLRRPKAAAAA